MKNIKTNDKYGMIAQDLLTHLPKEFKSIVKETKDKKQCMINF